MKIFRFVVFFSLSLALYYFLDNPYGQIPPMGKFLSPHQGFWQNAERPISLPETLTSDQISSSVQVSFDDLYIPHITGNNTSDVHFAQGYVTAYHRLWQMDFYMRVVYGRLSEVLGSRALDYDRLNRRMGLKMITEQFYLDAAKNPEIRAVLSAYSNGVNAYISSLSPADYPLEFKLLDYEPELWTPEKTVMIYALLVNNLTGNSSDLENTNLRTLLGQGTFELLFPDKLGNLSPVIPSGTPWPFTPELPKKPSGEFPYQLTPENIPMPTPLNGSNNFAVDGTKSKSGFPILTNEMDLELTAPSIWYMTHLTTSDMNVMGVTAPGTPLIIVGWNDSIAWGMSNSPRDLLDWYAIQFRNADRQEYRYNNQWFKTALRLENFDVKGEATFVDTIISTHHGPVVFDRNYKGDNEKVNYALRWSAHELSKTFIALINVNKASNFTQFTQALADFSAPPQNILFASTNGDIGLSLPGKFPNKWPEQGKFLLDGTNPSHDWQGFIPDAHRMSVLNSKKGFLSSANQHQVDSLYPYYIYPPTSEKYRNRRINDRLELLFSVTVQDMMKLQHDNYNYVAYESLLTLLSYLDTSNFSSSQRQQYTALSEWELFNQPELVEPTVFELWTTMLYESLWDEFDTFSVTVNKPEIFTTVHLIKTDTLLPFYDRLSTNKVESLRMLINESFSQAIDSVESLAAVDEELLKWHKFKGTAVTHFLRIPIFSTNDIYIGGSKKSVNAVGKGHGPSMRMVVELNPAGVEAYCLYPGSQTGNPGNPNYGHMIDDWATGKYPKLNFSRTKLPTANTTHTLTINPSSK